MHKAPPMDALNIQPSQHIIFFAFLANARVVCILNNLAIKIWAGLFFYLVNHCDIQSTNRKATNIEVAFFQEL
jgi:hypothetical protein